MSAQRLLGFTSPAMLGGIAFILHAPRRTTSA